MAYPTIEELVNRSKETRKSHAALPLLAEQRAKGTKMSGTLIICYIDPRCVPESIFNLKDGEVICHRNGGGRARYALQDISILDIIVGLDEIAVLHHTDCGATLYSDEGMRTRLKGHYGPGNDELIDRLDIGAIGNLEESVRQDLAELKESPLVRKSLSEKAQGFIYDVQTGELRRVA